MKTQLHNQSVSAPPASKRCPNCKQTKPLNTAYFARANREKSGFQGECKACAYRRRASQYARLKSNPEFMARNREVARQWRHKTGFNATHERLGVSKGALRRYKLTLSDYEQLLVLQNWKCAGCDEEHPRGGLVVDHCHTSGIVRGLLCVRCNAAAGMLKDDPARAVRLSRYLQVQQVAFARWKSI